MASRKSIVLVTVDCLRADHVGFMGYSRPTTPFLDALAAESTVVPCAIVAGAPTYYSLPAVLASRYPLALGRDVLGLAPHEPSLAVVLQRHGYKTAAFAAANPYISPRFGYSLGFDVFHDFLNDDSTTRERPSFIDGPNWSSKMNQQLQRMRSGMGPLGAVYDEAYFRYCQWRMPKAGTLDVLRRFPSADVVVDRAAEWIASIGDAPAFLWLHLMDPHSPYYPKAEALNTMGDSFTPSRARYLNAYWNRSDLSAWRLKRRLDEIIQLYDAGIRWADVQMERLSNILRRSNRWDQCIFVLTADHGEEFLDHGGRYHPPSRLMEELIRVPLILRAPGMAKTNVCRSPFNLINLAPTLLDAVQIPAPDGFQGKSYWEWLASVPDSNGVAISESVASCSNPFHPQHRLGARVLSVRESRFKLILYFDPPADELYDLEADPHEQAALPPTAEKIVRRRLLEIAREHLQASREQRDQKVRVQARARDFRLEWEIPADRISSSA